MSSEMIRVVQWNMNRTTASQLLEQIAREEDADILLLSEQLYNRNDSSWFSDDTKACAIYIRGSAQNSLTRHGKGNCHVWATCGDTTFISCYLSPNDTVEVFTAKLASIEATVREVSGNIIVAGDFNARAIEWGMSTTNPRGRRVLEMAARLNLVIQNTGNRATYERPGWGTSIPDITLASEAISRRVVN